MFLFSNIFPDPELAENSPFVGFPGASPVGLYRSGQSVADAQAISAVPTPPMSVMGSTGAREYQIGMGTLTAALAATCEYPSTSLSFSKLSTPVSPVSMVSPISTLSSLSTLSPISMVSSLAFKAVESPDELWGTISPDLLSGHDEKPSASELDNETHNCLIDVDQNSGSIVAANEEPAELRGRTSLTPISDIGIDEISEPKPKIEIMSPVASPKKMTFKPVAKKTARKASLPTKSRSRKGAIRKDQNRQAQKKYRFKRKSQEELAFTFMFKVVARARQRADHELSAAEFWHLLRQDIDLVVAEYAATAPNAAENFEEKIAHALE